MARSTFTIPQRVGDAGEIDYGKASGRDFALQPRDRIAVRSMQHGDLQALISIDRRITGRDRSRYFERKLAEALNESDVRVSLVADQDGVPAGFIMARVDFGGFGRLQPVAVLDTIGVDPAYRDRGVGRALLSQLLINLAALRVEAVRTELHWRDRDLLAFLDRYGFCPSQHLSFDRSMAAAAATPAGAGRLLDSEAGPKRRCDPNRNPTA